MFLSFMRSYEINYKRKGKKNKIEHERNDKKKGEYAFMGAYKG